MRTSSLDASRGSGASEPPATSGAEPSRRWEAYQWHVLVGSINGAGLEVRSAFGWRRPLWSRDTLLFRDSRIGLAISPRANPSFARVGPLLEMDPIAFLRLSAGAEYVQYSSLLGNMQSYPTARASYSDRRRAEDAEDAYVTGALHAIVEPTLRVKVGRMAARARLTADWWDVDLEDGDTVFYESLNDLLAPDRGWVLTETADVLWLPRRDLVLGGRWTRTHALYGSTHYLEGERRSDPNAHARAGLLAAWTPPDLGWAVGRPSGFVLVGWWLEHRYRAETPNARATPNVILGISLETGGDR